MTTDLNEAQQQKDEFRIALILANLDPVFESFKAQILAGEKLPTAKNTFEHLNHSFLR